MNSITKLFLGAVFVLAPAISFAATVQNTVTARTSCGDPAPAAINETESTSLNLGQNSGLTTTTCKSGTSMFAGGGVVAIRGDVTQFPAPGNQTHEVDFSAQSIMRGIMIVPDGSLSEAQLLSNYGSTISVGLNADATGVASSRLDAGSTSSRFASARLRAFAEISGFIGGAPQRNSSTAFVQSTDSNISGQTGPQNLPGGASPSITVSWDKPLEVLFRLQGELDTAGYNDSLALASIAASDSLSFSKTGFAFILPDGFTVNAPELNIFNNRWVDPREPIAPSPVPIPAGSLLMLSGLGFFALARRRRRN
jgi:hypothetical protein